MVILLLIDKYENKRFCFGSFTHKEELYNTPIGRVILLYFGTWHFFKNHRNGIERILL